MLVCVRTTIEINDALFARAKELVKEHNTTMKELIERGLQHIVEAENTNESFELKDVSVGGDGPLPGVDLHNWSQIRDLLYEDPSDCC